MKQTITVTDTEMRHDERRKRGEGGEGETRAALTLFPFCNLLLPYLPAVNSFFTVHGVTCFVISCLSIGTFGRLIVDVRVETHVSSRRIPRMKTAITYT